MDTPRLSWPSVQGTRARAGSDSEAYPANGTSTQSKAIGAKWGPPLAISGVYRIEPGSPLEHSEEGSDKRFRDRSLHLRRVATHNVFKAHHTRPSNDRERRGRRRTQGSRRIVSVLSRMWKRGTDPLTKIGRASCRERV